MTDNSHYAANSTGAIRCAFCGQTPDQVNAMISGPNGIYICYECVSVCA